MFWIIFAAVLFTKAFLITVGIILAFYLLIAIGCGIWEFIKGVGRFFLDFGKIIYSVCTVLADTVEICFRLLVLVPIKWTARKIGAVLTPAPSTLMLTPEMMVEKVLILTPDMLVKQEK